MSAFFRQIVSALGLTSLFGMSHAADNKLTATVADISGKCMVEASWVDVSGRYIYWDVSGPGVRTDWHKSDLVHPKGGGTASDIEESPVLRAPFAFALNLSAVRGSGPASDRAWPEMAYRDAMRIKMKMPNLVAAVMVHRVKESDLWRRNLTNESNIFNKDNWERSYYVPTGYSVCDLQIRYLMNRAEAVFEKRLIGKVVIRSNQTVPLRSGERSFAEEILDRRY